MSKLLSIILILSNLISLGQLRINEFSAHKGVSDLGDSHDWIEIMNTSSSAINLSSYYISDNESNLQKWQMPDYDLGPSEFIVICASDKDISTRIDHWESLILPNNDLSYFLGTSEPPANWNHLTFDDSSWETGNGGVGYGDGDDNVEISWVSSVYLRYEFDLVDLAAIQALVLAPDYDDSYVAYLNGVEISRSINIDGFPPAFDQFATTDIEATLYQDIIPELVTINPEQWNDLLVEGQNVFCTQVHNASAFSSDLSSNFYLASGIVDNSNNYQDIPEWLVPSTGNAFYHTNFKISIDEQIILSDASGNIEDSKYIDSNLSQGISQGRSPDGIGDWCFFDNPSPTFTNGVSWCYEGITPAPIISLESGWYDSPQSTSIFSDASTVYFTNTGDLPDETDAMFVEDLTFESNSVLSARAFSDGNLLPSPVVDRTFIFDQDNYNLPVFSIITDEDNLWDWETGIYVSGPFASTDYPFYGSNFWQPWSKFSRLEYFEANKTKVAEEQLDLEIHGGWSRAEPQKSFRLDMKSEYSGRIETPLFNQKPFITDFNNINLRNGGQHLGADKIQDGLISRIINETNADNMAYEPCILYLNGEYWGIYGIREKIDEHYIESNHGVLAEEVDLMNSFTVLAGSDQHFNESHSLIISTPADDENFYDLAASRFDLENYMDYFIIETFIQNMDWLGIAWGVNNVKLWRPQTEDGKWRYVVYDTDGGLGFFGQGIFGNYLAFARDPLVDNAHSQIFDKMLDNEQFKCEFTSRYADLMNTIFQTTNVQEKAEEIHDALVNGMTDHVNLWNAPPSVGEWQTAINDVVEYASNRIGTARLHLNNNLELQGQVEITLDVMPEGAGQIKISTIYPETFPWTGIYFDGCPVAIEALAAPGYDFSHWLENDIIGGESEEQNLLLNLFQDDSFVAVFEEEVIIESISENVLIQNVEVYPNPTSDKIIVEHDFTSSEIQAVRIYNTLGQVIEMSKNNYSNSSGILEIDVSKLPSGMYQMDIDHGRERVKSKFIIL